MYDFIINDIQNKKSRQTLIFHFYFLNKDISLSNRVKRLIYGIDFENIHMEGTVFQIFYLGFRFYFISKKGNFWSFPQT